ALDFMEGDSISAGVGGIVPPEPPKEIDPRERLKKYLEAQIAMREGRQSPENLMRMDENRAANFAMRGDNNFAAVLSRAASNAGTINGKKATPLIPEFAKAQNEELSQFEGSLRQGRLDLNQEENDIAKLNEYLMR